MNKESYQPMECPVCHDFFFSELGEEDSVGNLHCSHCGWLYDLNQAADPNLKVGRNAQSVSDLRALFHARLIENPNYDYAEEHRLPKTPHLCPICERYTFKDRDSFDICPVCGWTDDGLMEEEPDRWAGSSNDLCLLEYKQRYLHSNTGN